MKKHIFGGLTALIGLLLVSGCGQDPGGGGIVGATGGQDSGGYGNVASPFGGTFSGQYGNANEYEARILGKWTSSYGTEMENWVGIRGLEGKHYGENFDYYTPFELQYAWTADESRILFEYTSYNERYREGADVPDDESLEYMLSEDGNRLTFGVWIFTRDG